jgi:hypothetical protein
LCLSTYIFHLEILDNFRYWYTVKIVMKFWVS